MDRQNPMVFCIGWPKTGTTSIHEALKIIGYRALDWPRAHIPPRNGWINYIKKSKFDAFSDVPINNPRLYKELYKEFPNSKFILTFRDPETLTKSWINFFKYTPWSIDTEKERIKLITNYKNHFNEAIDFFKDKPSKLLIINIIEGDGWKKLCDFLNKSIPNKPFPHSNKGKYRKK